MLAGVLRTNDALYDEAGRDDLELLADFFADPGQLMAAGALLILIGDVDEDLLALEVLRERLSAGVFPGVRGYRGRRGFRLLRTRRGRLVKEYRLGVFGRLLARAAEKPPMSVSENDVNV